MGSGFDCSLDCRSCNYILKFCFSQLKQTRPATAWFWLSKQTRWPPHIFPRGRRNKQTSVSRVCVFPQFKQTPAGHRLVFGCRNKLVGHRTYTGSPKQTKFCQQSSNKLAGPQFVSGCGCGNKLYRRLPLSQGPLKQTNFCQQSLFFAAQTNSAPAHSLFLVVGNKLVGHRIYACHFPRGRRNKQTSVSRVCFFPQLQLVFGCRNKLVGHRTYTGVAETNKILSAKLKQTRRATICFWLWLWKQALPPPATFPGAAETNKLLSAEFVFRGSNKLTRPQFVFGCRNKLVGHRIYACHFPRGRPKQTNFCQQSCFSAAQTDSPGHSLFLVVETNSLATAYTPATFLGVAETNKFLSAEFVFPQFKQTRPGCRNNLVCHRIYAYHFPRGRRNKQTSVSRVCFSAVQTDLPGRSLFLVVETNSTAHMPATFPGVAEKKKLLSAEYGFHGSNKLTRAQFVLIVETKSLSRSFEVS